MDRVKSLKGPRPHNQADADGGGDLGKPDNGPRLRSQNPQTPAPDLDCVMEDLKHM